MKKENILLTILAISLLIVIGIMIYYNWFYLKDNSKTIDNNSNLNQSQIQVQVKKHVPVVLGKDDILVSFRIDDITFEKKQKPVLENALHLARKYNITFDLAVIADRFDRKMDPEVFKIYEENQDVFEVVAHGWIHIKYFDNSTCGEFRCAPYETQEEKISKMKEIFEKHGLYWGTKIFLTPWHGGDDATIELSDKYGYILLFQEYLPIKGYEYTKEDILVLKTRIAVSLNESLTVKQIEGYRSKILEFADKDQKKIHIVTHLINFYKIENSEELIKEIISLSKDNPKIKFGMISDGLIER